MATTNEPSKKVHHGRNVRRFREMMGMKQEAFAGRLGKGWSQKRVSTLELKEKIDEDTLEKLADALKVPTEAIKNFDEERAIYVMSNTFNNGGAVWNINPTFNPVDKLLSVIDENKKLYEALLKSEREKIEILQKVLQSK